MTQNMYRIGQGDPPVLRANSPDAVRTAYEMETIGLPARLTGLRGDLAVSGPRPARVLAQMYRAYYDSARKLVAADLKATWPLTTDGATLLSRLRGKFPDWMEYTDPRLPSTLRDGIRHDGNPAMDDTLQHLVGNHILPETWSEWKVLASDRYASAIHTLRGMLNSLSEAARAKNAGRSTFVSRRFDRASQRAGRMLMEMQEQYDTDFATIRAMRVSAAEVVERLIALDAMYVATIHASVPHLLSIK